jgi:hypothetical protein
MSTFRITTTFSQTDLERLHATGTNIVVAKPTEGTEPNVSWVVYRPLQTNTVEWQEQYGIYASNVDFQNGAELSQLSSTDLPALTGRLYVLNPSGVFSGPGSGGETNLYSARNDFNNLDHPDPGTTGRGYLTMGLYQNATVNEVPVTGNAVSATQVLYRSTARIRVSSTVYLWTQSQTRGNSVVTDISSPMTMVPLTAERPEANLRFDADSATFIPVDTSKEESIDGVELKVRMPRGIVCCDSRES